MTQYVHALCKVAPLHFEQAQVHVILPAHATARVPCDNTLTVLCCAPAQKAVGQHTLDLDFELAARYGL